MNILENNLYLPLVYAVKWISPVEANHKSHLNGLVTTPNGNYDCLILLEFKT